MTTEYTNVKRTGPDADLWFQADGDPARYHPVVVQMNDGSGYRAGWSLGGAVPAIDSRLWPKEEQAWTMADVLAEAVCEAEARHRAKEETARHPAFAMGYSLKP